MPEIVISGAGQYSDEVKIGVAKMYDVRVCDATGWTGTVIVERRRSDQADWFPVEDQAYDGTTAIDRVGKVASIHWVFRIGSPDASAGTIRAGIWTD